MVFYNQNRKMKNWCTLIMLLIGLGLGSCTNQSSDTQSESSNASDYFIPVEEDVLFLFEYEADRIAGEDRVCESTKAKVFIGDVNDDNKLDGLVQYACHLGESLGNVSMGNGLVLFLNDGIQLDYHLYTEDFNQFVPEKIEHGEIVGTQYRYAEGDARCCPSIKEPMTLIFQKDSFVKKK